jgi:Tfp pilus assembly protein PilO
MDRERLHGGVNMRPAERRERPPARRAKAAEPIPLWDRRALLLLMAVAGVICIAMVISMSYAASIKRETNQTIKETAAIHGEIETLRIKINDVVDIEAVERRAAEMGMVYPSAEQFVYLDRKTPDTTESNDFAQYIKENAYQLR